MNIYVSNLSFAVQDEDLKEFFINRLIWIAGSIKTNGEARFMGKTISGQMVSQYMVIRFYHKKDTVFFNGPDNVSYERGEPVGVRFQPGNPADARINSLLSLWGDTLIFSAVPLLILLVIHFHPDLIPRKANIKLQLRKPRITILSPYESHDDLGLYTS